MTLSRWHIEACLRQACTMQGARGVPSLVTQRRKFTRGESDHEVLIFC